MKALMMPRRMTAGIAVLCAAMMAACGGGGSDTAGPTTPTTPTTPQVGSVSLTVPATTLQVGATVSASAEVRSTTGATLSGRAVNWSSSNSAFATVTDAGVITGMAPGTVSITATSEGRTGTVVLNVIQASVNTVTLTLPAAQVIVARTLQATVVLRDERNVALTGRTLTYVSSNPAVATVDGAGLITGVAAGTTNITASSEGKSATAELRVVPAPVNSVTVTLAQNSVAQGTTTTATAVLRDDQGATLIGRDVVWISSNPQVATVNNGNVAAVGAGTSTITATSEGRSGSALLTVSPAPVATVLVSLSQSSITVGATAQATASARDANGNPLTGRLVQWSSSNPGVATVAGNGQITAVSAGTTTVSATSEGRTGSATLTITPVPVASVTVTTPLATLTVGTSTQAVATLRGADGSSLIDRPVTWGTSAPSVATVSNGLITAVAPGTAVISASSEGRTGTLAIIVQAPAPATVVVNPPAASLSVGRTLTLNASVRDAAGNTLTDVAVSWSSSNPGVASVSPAGIVTAVSPGVANITASAGGRTGSASIAVQNASAASVSLNVGTVTMLVGDVRLLVATVRDALSNVLTGRPITWTTSNPAVVDGQVLEESALITGLSPGVATVTATVEGRSASAIITVLSGAPSVCTTIAGAELYGDDGQYLGRFTNRFDSQSILNTIGRYGSSVSSTSTNNSVSIYGSSVSSLSAWNTIASRPPLIFTTSGRFIAYYSVNTLKTPRVSPAVALNCSFP